MVKRYVSPVMEMIELNEALLPVLEVSGSGIVDPIDGGELEW